jgi:heat shock protein HslJ
MTPMLARILCLLPLLVAFVPGPAFTQAHPSDDKTAAIEARAIPVEVSQPGLGSTSWQLVKFEGGDGKVLIPRGTARYQVAFSTDGGVSVRIDCNSGHGMWKSSEQGQVEMGPLALTRAMCPAAKLTDRLARDWSSVQSYSLQDGHLFLLLPEGGGAYEFEPVP